MLYLISLLKKYMMVNNYVYPVFYKSFVSTLGGLIAVVIMSEPVIYYGARLDLRSVPIFLIAYINGWKYGLITAFFPLLYRIYLGDPTVLEWIIFDIFIALLIGVIGYIKNQDRDSVIVNIQVKNPLLLYLLVLFLTYLVPLLWFPIPFLYWLEIIIILSFSSLLTIYLSILLINELNRGIYRNLIEFSKTKEELSEREKELERKNLNFRYFSNISHEFKTPLNLIFFALQMLKKYSENKLKIEDEKVDRYLTIIKQNGYRLLRLVDNIIDINRIDVNSFNLHLVNEDIVRVVKDIVFSVEEHIKDKNRKLNFNTNIDSKVMAIDPGNLERVILNLISNAMKFTGQGDTISISIKEYLDTVEISVSDTGIGIDKDKQKCIFELFRQADESFSRRSEGSGIGLYIVKLIVELHGGKVWVESEKGRGSRFSLQIPVRILPDESEVEQSHSNELIDKIEIEFSDIYNL